MTDTTLPTNLSYITVEGRFLADSEDTADAGQNPDGVAMVGVVRFRPTAHRLVDVGASPAPVNIFPKTITGPIDVEGYLRNPGGTEKFIKLIAPDDVDLIAFDSSGNRLTSWYYVVEFAFSGPVSATSTFSQALVAAGGSTVDLAELLADSEVLIVDGGTPSSPGSGVLDGGTP